MDRLRSARRTNVHSARRLRRAALVLLLTAAGCSPAAARQVDSGQDARAARASDGPRTRRVLGYYDTALRRVVVVGGPEQLRGVPRRDRVWSWTGARWEAMSDSGPPRAGNAAVAYDPRRAMALFTGGARVAADDTTITIVGESWQGGTRGWHPMSGADITARDHHAMVFDEARQTLLLFSGLWGDRSDPWPNDTWALRPEGWVRVATEGPLGRGRMGLAYDARRRQVVLFGGAGAAPGPGQEQPFFGDTWVWEGTAWRKVAEGGPRGRYAHGMVYDERAGVVLMYSGAAAHRGAPLEDMWQWDGERWTEISLTGPTPGHRYSPVMVYDRARGVTALYGGSDDGLDAVWEWDGRGWKEIRM